MEINREKAFRIYQGFEEYSDEVRQSMLPSIKDAQVLYSALNLASEAGEVCGKLAKALRDNGGDLNKDELMEIAKEIGDVYWCATALADGLSMAPGGVALGNVNKIRDRMDRGVVGGSGDNR